MTPDEVEEFISVIRDGKADPYFDDLVAPVLAEALAGVPDQEVNRVGSDVMGVLTPLIAHLHAQVPSPPAKERMRVSFVSNDFNWPRCVLPARSLNAAGHQAVIGRAVATSSGLGVVANGVRHEDLDAVIIGRWAMTRDLREHVARTRASGQLVVQDMDDLAWGGNDGEDRAWAKGGLALVDLVVCSTPYLADRARQAGARNVVVIRNMIDAERFAPVDQPETRPVFGWSGTVRTRERDVAVLRGVLGSFLEANACRFHHAGSHHGDAPPFARHAGLRPDLVTASGHEWPWRSELLYVDFHVGVIPLARSPWNLGKSALKGLEMAAAGIPAIASDTPEYRWAESEGLCVTARHPADWKRHLTRLLDRDERVAQADEARAAVKAHTPEARGDEWADALEEAMR